MTFKSYIQTITSAGVFSFNQDEIIIHFYDAAGATEGVTKENAQQWVVRDSPGKPAKYFQALGFDGYKIDGFGFIEHLRENIGITWRKLQYEFKLWKNETDKTANSEIGNKSTDKTTKKRKPDRVFPFVIATDTDNKEVFFYSMLKQFLVTLDLPSDMIYDILPINEAIVRHIEPRYEQLFGRNDEIKNIDHIFELSNYAVLTGISGIGKSCIALAYAHKLNKKGEYIIQQVICEDFYTLEDAVNQLLFDGLVEEDNQDYKGYKFDRRVKALQACEQPTLIILDNLNRRFTQDDLANLRKLIKCKYVKFLITSRNTLTLDKQNVEEIKPLDIDSLLNLYAHYRLKPSASRYNKDTTKYKEFIYKHEDILKEIFKQVGHHTLAIELLAKLALRDGLDEHALLKILENDFDVPLTKVGFSKDDTDFEGTIKGIIARLFSLFKLTNDEKYIMLHMALVPVSGIKLRIFKMLLNCDADEINSLIDNSLIEMDDVELKIWLHPLISETVLDMASLTNETFYAFVRKLLALRNKSTIEDDTWHSLSKVLLHANLVRHGRPIKKMLPFLKEEYRSALNLFTEMPRVYNDSNDMNEYRMNVLKLLKDLPEERCRLKRFIERWSRWWHGKRGRL